MRVTVHLLKPFVYVFFLIVLCLGACKKKSNAPHTASKPENIPVYMKGTINSNAWVADSSGGYSTVVSNSTSETDLLIMGTDTATGRASQILLYISDFTGAGTYTINPPVISATYYIGNERYYAASGQIIVASYSPSATLGVYSNVQGSFSFMADSINASGSFSVELH